MNTTTVDDRPAATGRSGSKRGVLLIAAGLAAALAIWMLGTQYLDWGTSASGVDSAQIAFEAETGVHIEYLALTAAGGMLELRYRVLDPDKAVIVHDLDNPPRIVRGGEVVGRSWMDHAHDSDRNLGVTYHELLMNVGRAIDAGDEVTVMIGEAHLDNVPVLGG